MIPGNGCYPCTVFRLVAIVRRTIKAAAKTTLPIRSTVPPVPTAGV